MPSDPTYMRQHIDSICSEFGDQWESSEQVSFGTWLDQVPDDHKSILLEELVRIDVALKAKNEIPVNPESYEVWGQPFVEIAQSMLAGGDSSVVYGESANEDQTIPPSALLPDDVIRKIDNYELIRELGGGGMGQVYLGRHHKFRNRHYAIKLLKPNLVSKEIHARFEHEINVAGKLEHPNIVFSHDAGRAGDEPYLVMEFIQGCDLQELVNENGPLAIPNACELIRQTSIGLDYAFQKAGLTHRDIKPSNLMLTSDGKVKILDMGLARLLEQSTSMALTSEGQMLGTPDYMAPEQWNESSKVSTTADIYSLACSLFTLLTGFPPFYSDEKTSLTAKMSAHVLDPPPEISGLRDDIPKELADVIDQCLSKEPSKRIQSAGEMADALEPYCDGHNLSEYKIAVSAMGAAARVPTRSVMDQSTNVGEKKSASQPVGSPSLLTPKSIIAAVILFVLSLALFSFYFGGDSDKNTANNSPDLEEQKNRDKGDPGKGFASSGKRPRTLISAVRLSADQEYIDKINNNSPEGQVVFEGERSRLEVLLPERRYLMVLGITPNEGEDKVYCLWPKDSSTPSQYCDGFIYGKRASEQLTIKDFTENHDLAVREGTWKYSDGTGLHSFVVISSQTLLPSFDEVKDELLKIDWPTKDVEPRHWMIRDGEAFVHEFQRIMQRGTDDSETFSLQPVVNHIKSLFKDAHVDGIVFNVEKNSAGE